jgi:DNA-binding SARP family transcriptional activator
VDGAGAIDTARTLIAALLLTAPAATLVTDHHTATALLGAQPQNRQSDRDDAAPLRVLAHPHAALDLATTTLGVDTPSGDSSRRPLVLLLPTPTGSIQRHALAELLRRHPTDLAAIIHGIWPPGWNCHVDAHRHITGHSPPDPRRFLTRTRPAYLTGAIITPTSTAQLSTLLGTRPNADTPTRHDDTAAPPDRESDGTNNAAIQPSATTTAAGADSNSAETSTTPPSPDEAPPERRQRTSGPAGSQPAEPPEPPEPRWRATMPPLRLSILGPAALHHLHPADNIRDREPVTVTGLGPRATELLIYLAAHPHGVHRDALVAALWPDTGPDRPTNALNSTLTRLRKTLRALDPELATLVQHTNGRYQLHPELVSVDYWDLLVAATDLTHTDEETRRHACDAIMSIYRGPLAAEHTGEWLVTLRETVRRRYLDAVTTLARITIDNKPEQTLDLLETARNLEPLNEAIYRDIIRIQQRLGRPDAAAATFQLLHAQLADIDATPSPATVALARKIGELAPTE